MLPAAVRLRRRSEFSATVRGGVRAGRRRLVVHALPGDGDAAPRVGFVVGRVVGPATVRNRVRRRLRHLMAERLGRIGEALPGGRIVVRALPPAADATSTELGADLDRVLDRVLRAARGPAPEPEPVR